MQSSSCASIVPLDSNFTGGPRDLTQQLGSTNSYVICKQATHHIGSSDLERGYELI